jgi:glycosyltransferase involved in cell wall biosynthesis
MAKILIVAHPHSPHTRTRGLIGQQAGHQIFWVSTPKVNLPNVTAFGPPLSSGRLGRLVLEPVVLELALRRVKPDLIHVHGARQGLRTPVLLAHHTPLIVSTMGGDILPDQSFVGVHAHLVRALLNRADFITSKSDFLDDVLARMGDYRLKTRRINWGIDLDRFQPGFDVSRLRQRWQIPAGDLVFFDSRLARPLYNKDIILTAFAQYVQSGGPAATLLVAELFPDSGYPEQLHRLAHELGLEEKVRFLGALNHADMPGCYVLADVTLSIPSSDGVPQTLYEALACGSFPIVGALPQYAGLVQDGLTARLVPPRDSPALAQALLWVAANPEIRARAQRLGRAYVEQHADQRVQSALVNQIYTDLLQRHANHTLA